MPYMSDDPEIRIVKVPTIPIHPHTLAKYKAQRAEMDRLLTPEALARIDAAERELLRQVIRGHGT